MAAKLPINHEAQTLPDTVIQRIMVATPYQPFPSFISKDVP